MSSPADIFDLAIMARQNYFTKKENIHMYPEGTKISDLFDTACKEVYRQYGLIFEIKDESSFKSYVSRVLHALRNNLPAKALTYGTKPSTPEINEGSGISFTLKQIDELNLNPESYL